MIFFSGWHKIISILFGNSKIQKRNSCASLLGVTITNNKDSITNNKVINLTHVMTKYEILFGQLHSVWIKLASNYLILCKLQDIFDFGARVPKDVTTYRITENLLVHWFAAIVVFICVLQLIADLMKNFSWKNILNILSIAADFFYFVNFCPQNVGRCCCWWWCNIHFP